MLLRRIIRRAARAVRDSTSARGYQRSMRRGEATGELVYISAPLPDPGPPLVELRLRADGERAVDRDEAQAWVPDQTLVELSASKWKIGFTVVLVRSLGSRWSRFVI